MFYRKYIFGDSAVYYTEVPLEGHEGKTQIGLAIYPADCAPCEGLYCDSLVQAAFTGDELLIDYTGGVTMRNREATLLSVEDQTASKSGVVTRLTDGRGNFYTHVLRYFEQFGVFSASVRYENRTGGVRTLEMLSSFSLNLSASDGVGLTLHRMTSAWSRECRLKSEELSSLGLDMSWARYGVKCERWGEAGSMSNRGWFPFAAVEDSKAQITWGVMLEAPFSWQLELYKEKESCALSGGLADYEFGHWRKDILPDEAFQTHEAFITVKKGGVNDVCNALVKEADRRLCVPESEEEMPVLFNEYCTTWGCPSEENIERILEALKPLPIGTFVIDCGWYKPDDKGWCNAIGDWQESRALFPAGVRRVAQKIRDAGMIPGIWFEFEVAGRDSACFSREELLLHRDGKPITAKNRRFLDLRKEEVTRYLNERFLKFLRENGFGYLKIDYNDTYGVGCDSSDGEAIGEGGRQVAEESLRWLERIKEAVPDIILENCASGGSRIEPLRMSKVAMCSFSDAHECAEIPLVAANVSRVIPARQMQIWAVLREGDTLSRVIYSLCAAMLGRICLSGELSFTEEKLSCIREGLEFYQTVKQIVRNGDITAIDCSVKYYRDPKGRQVYVKTYGRQRLVIVHCLDFEGEVRIPLEGYVLKRAFTDLSYSAEGVLALEGKPFRAGAFLLEKPE